MKWLLVVSLLVGTAFGACVITTPTPPPATAGIYYSSQLSSSGCGTGVTWRPQSGSLPLGMSLTSAGMLAGTPGLAGVYHFSLRASGTLGTSANTKFRFTVNAAPLPPVVTPPPTAKTVTLNWTASPTVGVTYRVYRSQTSGSGYTLVGAATGLTYSDTNVTLGQTYYYVVRSVLNNVESDNSNQATAVIQ